MKILLLEIIFEGGLLCRRIWSFGRGIHVDNWCRSHAKLISVSIVKYMEEYNVAVTFWKTAYASSKSRVAKKCWFRCFVETVAHALATAVNDGSNSLDTDCGQLPRHV